MFRKRSSAGMPFSADATSVCVCDVAGVGVHTATRDFFHTFVNADDFSFCFCAMNFLRNHIRSCSLLEATGQISQSVAYNSYACVFF